MRILGCRFTFKAYAKNVREKTTKCSLKTAIEFYWMLMDMWLPVVTKVRYLHIVLRATQTIDVLISFKKMFV